MHDAGGYNLSSVSVPAAWSAEMDVVVWNVGWNLLLRSCHSMVLSKLSEQPILRQGDKEVAYIAPLDCEADEMACQAVILLRTSSL